MLIAEELLMIALDDEEGTEITPNNAHQFNTLGEAIDSAMQLELVFAGKLNINSEAELVVVNDTPTGDHLLDEILDAIIYIEKKYGSRYYVGKSFGDPRLKWSLLDRLVDAQVLRRVRHPLRKGRDRFLWVIPQGVDPQSESLPERVLRKRIRDVVQGGIPADERTLALICLVQACGLMQEVFPQDDLEATHQQVKMLISASPAVLALDRALQDHRDHRPKHVDDRGNESAS
jgi:hypothetical protein